MAQKMRYRRSPAQDHRVVPDGTIRVSPLMNLPEILCEFGCDPQDVLAKSGFTLEQFKEPDTEISYAAGSKLLANCIAVTGTQHLGLLIGERANMSTLGIAGFIARSASTVGAGLRDLVHNLDLHDQGGSPTLQTRGSVTLLGYCVHQPGAEALDLIYDIALAQACNILRDLAGANLNLSEVMLSRRAPRDLAPYRRFFRAPLRFDSEQNAVVFPTCWLDHPLTSADPLLHHHLVKEANELHNQRPGDTIEIMRRLLRKSLPSRKIALNHIASQLCLHERTLLRRLHESGTNYRRELETVRYEVARQMLAESRTTLPKISNSLGYTDVSTFIRAFKRWSGMTPAQWRET